MPQKAVAKIVISACYASIAHGDLPMWPVGVAVTL